MILLLVLVLGACAAGEDAAEPPPPIGHPEGADERVLSVLSTGRYGSAAGNLSDLPDFVLYGDGRLFSRVWSDPSAPPPVPEVLVRTISPPGVQAVLRSAEDAGLLDPEEDYGHPGILDGPTTYIEARAGGRERRHEVYLLGSLLPDPVDWPVLSRRLAVQAWHERLYDLEAWLPEGSVGAAEPADFATWLLFAEGQGRLQDLELEAVPPRWPLPEPLASAPSVGAETRCRTLTTAEVDTLRQAAGSAPELSWVSEGVVFGTHLRPLLPGEAGCESVVDGRPDR